jgi:predicted ATP-grasp superfamily ATP-dependent carboligase
VRVTGATPPAVVVGLDNITGLQTSRILHARGVTVIGLAGDRAHFGARTNTCADIIETPLRGDRLIATLHDLAGRLGERAVLFPCTDEAVLALSLRRDELPSYLLPLAPHDVVEMLLDKASFAEHAQASGLPIPDTVVLRSRADAEAAALSLSFPAVVKPSTKGPSWLDQTRAKALPVAGPRELLETYDRVREWAPVLLAQEWVDGSEGGLYSCNAYFDAQGEALVSFVARKLRQWPPGVGTSASGEECRQDDVLKETMRTFGSARFHGLAYLELKLEPETGRLLIIEPNVGRPTGRSAIAERGGVELVYTAYCDAVGLPVPRTPQLYLGTKWLDLRRDVQAAVVARRRGELTIREWAASVRGPKAHAIWSLRDPVPFGVDLVHATGSGLRRWRSRSHLSQKRSPAPDPSSPP